MTIQLQLNDVLHNVFSTMGDIHDNNKIKIDAQGRVTDDNRHRFHLFTNANTVAADTRNTIRTLRTALIQNFNDANTADRILNKYLTAEKINGTQRLTLKDLQAIKRSVEIRKTVQFLRQQFNNYVQNHRDEHNANVAHQKATGHELDIISLKTDPTNEQLAAIQNQDAENTVKLLTALKNRLPHDLKTASTTDMNKNRKLLKEANTVSKRCSEALMELKELTRGNNNAARREICNNLKKQFLQIMVMADRLRINIEGILDHKADLVKNFRDSYNDRIDTGTAIIDKLHEKIQDLQGIDNNRKQQVLQNLDRLSQELTSKKQNMTDRNDLDTVKNEDFNFFEDFASGLSKKLKKCIPGDIRNLLANDPESPRTGEKDIKSILDKSMAASGKWDVITKELPLHVDNKYNKTFKFVLTPLNKLSNVRVSQDFQDRDIHGRPVNNYTSGDRKVAHITNLIKTETRDGNGTVLFSGYRHGTTAAFKVEENQAREDATLNRTKELLRTIVEDKYLGALNNNPNIGTREQPLEINISAISLLTPSSMIGRDESRMFALQCRAWNQISGGEPLELSVKVPHPQHQGEFISRNVHIRPRVNIFNYPCQWQSINLNMGWRKSETYNRGSLNNMLGEHFMAGDVKLEDITGNNEQRLIDALGRINLDSQLGRFLSNENVPEASKKKAKILALEINLLTRKQPLLITSDRVQKQHNIDAYALPARIALLNSIMGNETCFNCKSGKDRTGQLDAEIRTLAANMSEVTAGTNIADYMNRNSDVIDVLKNGKYTSLQQENNMTSVAINSGIMEVHGLNTGVMGSKIRGGATGVSGVFNIGGGTPHRFNPSAFSFYKGASKHAKS